MILVIDNYDSFTYNLVQYLGELGARVAVHRNDRITVEEAVALRPARIVISPGPGRPEAAGITVDLVRRFAGEAPILGVCLGHQAIGLAFGGRVVGAPRLMHGKVSEIDHSGRDLFEGIPRRFAGCRYHSLMVADEGLPSDLIVTARAADDGVIMALRHRAWPVHGVQFHPESILTGPGREILRNFLAM